MKFNNIIRLFAAMAVVCSLSSCSDDDVDTPLTDTGEVVNSGTTYDSLSFEWDKIGGATQYGYELLDNNDELVYRDVTSITSATIGSLMPSTEYTLRVWGYAAIGSGHIASEPIIIKATTDPLKTLSAPRLSSSQAEVTNTVSWTRVTGATEYEYTLANAAGEQVDFGTVTSRNVTFTHLDNGTYTVTVKALSTTPGYEAAGESATLNFTVNIVPVWSAEGTYKSAVLGKSWDATIVCYGGGHYSILNWYGINGYNFDFYTDDADPDDMFQIYTYYTYDSETGNYAIPTGRSDIGSLYVYPWYNYSSIEGTKYKGSASFYVYLNGDYVSDTFTWKGVYDGIAADNFVGTWTLEMADGFTYLSSTGKFLDDGDWVDLTTTVEITKVDDNTIAMPAFFFSSLTVNVKIDMIDGVLTVDPMSPVFKYYTLAGTTSESSPIIGKINDDGTFEFNDWTVWYDGDQYYYYSSAKYSR